MGWLDSHLDVSGLKSCSENWAVTAGIFSVHQWIFYFISSDTTVEPPGALSQFIYFKLKIMYKVLNHFPCLLGSAHLLLNNTSKYYILFQDQMSSLCAECQIMEAHDS